MDTPETITPEQALAVTIQLYKELQQKHELLKKQVEKYEHVIEDTYNACLCDRQVRGFEYHQAHPRLGLPKVGARWMAPRDLIEVRIGYEWKYSKPEGVYDSWKVLKLIKNKLGESTDGTTAQPT